jgi:soluble lytic murein transglycosylase
MKFFLIAFALSSSLLFAQNEDLDIGDNELELLPPDVLKSELLRRELAMQDSKNATSSSTELAQAALFYYEKKWDSAYFAYTPLLEKASDFLYGPLAIRLAKCENGRGNFKEGRKLLLGVRSLKSNKNFWERADRVLVEGILLDSSITQDAKKDSLERRIKSKPSGGYEQFLKWNLANIHEILKDQKSAREVYFSILRGSRPYSDSAFKALQRLSPESEEYAFVMALCRKGYSEKCADRISSIFAKKVKLDSAKWVDLMVSQAEAWKQLSRIDLASKNYKKLLDSIDYNSVWMQSLLRMVRTTGNKHEAKRLDSIFQVKFPFSSENVNNLWVKALEQEQAGDYKKAIATYKQLYNPKFGKHQRRQWAKFRVGFINFKEKNYAEASSIFAEAANDNLGLMPRSASLFFYAESERMLGNRDNATNIFAATIADFPLGYYAWRAKHVLKEFELSNSIPKLGREMSQDSAVAWLRSLQKKEMGERDSLVSVERLEQIEILLRSGFAEEAFDLYDEVLKLHKSRPEFYYRYGLMFMQNGELALGFRLARNFIDMVPREKMADAPVQILKFLFPVPHEHKVRKHTKIDPYLVYSVMRQESMFDAKIQSPAGARGLLQIMPATGDNLARREKIDKFDKDLLFNAYLNIRLGIRYLNDLATEHKNDYIGILGEYNAGPAPANRWISNYGSQPWDIRVEEVSYWETRDYVKRVLGNYWTYKELYN